MSIKGCCFVGALALMVATEALAVGESVSLERCRHVVPDIRSLYVGHQRRIAGWGTRTVAPLGVYRSIGALEPTAVSPIHLYTFYPSAKGRWDKSVSQSESRRGWIDILAFPIVDKATLPTDGQVERLRRVYEESVATSAGDTIWNLREIWERPSNGWGAFFQPRDREGLVNRVPTFFCTASSLRIEKTSTCFGRLVVEPDIYVVYTFLQTLLPCWASVEDTVRKVIELNLLVEHKPATR